jgi:hypothetical protein
MVHIKFTARPQTPIVSPKFTPMASKHAATISTERRETSAEKPEESLVGEPEVVSTEVASEQGVGSDQENQSEGSGDSETASDDGECMKIGAVAALAGISYDFSQSTFLEARLAFFESVNHYFLKGYGQLPGVESVPNPQENEAVVFEDFFVAGLHMPPHPVLMDILR